MPTNNKSKQDKFNEALNFAQTYYDSKGFNERFEKAKSLLPKGFILHKTTFKAPKLKIVDKNNAYYNPNDNTIEYGMIADFNPLFHEFGHKIDHSIHLDKKNRPNWLFRKTPFRYSYSSIYPVFYRNKNLKSNDLEIRKSPLQDRKQNRLEHDSQPQESYADLMNLRYHLYNSGIYDSTKANNPFTQDHIDKLKEQFDFSLPENHGINRLFQNFNEKDIIEMMNTVAQNKYNDDQLQYARKGAKLISRKYGGLIPKFKDSGKVERNLSKKYKSGGYFYNGKVIKGQYGITIVPVEGRVNSAWDVNDILKEIHNNYKYYVNELGLTDDEYRSIAHTLMGVGGVESEYGSGKRYQAKSLLPDVAVDIYHVAKGKPGLQSRGIYQQKIGEEWIGAQPAVQAQYRNAYSRAGMSSLNQAPQQVASSPVYATRAALIRLANDAKALRSQPLFNKNGERVRLSDALAFRWHYGNDKNIKDSEINHDQYVTRAKDYSTRFLYK